MKNRKHKTRRNIFYAALCALCAIILQASAYAQKTNNFYQANIFYEKGNYDEAIKQYNDTLESGFESGNLYYNLGNCYFKKGRIGMAILNYEKARRLIPLDKDLESNYAYARSLIKGGLEEPKKTRFSQAVDVFFGKFTIDGLTITLSLLYILFLTCVLLGFIFPVSKKRFLLISVFISAFFIAAFVSAQNKAAALNRGAIVIAPEVTAKFEPANSATTHFTLYEGNKVEITASENNWHKIKRADKKSGWIEDSAVGIF